VNVPFDIVEGKANEKTFDQEDEIRFCSQSMICEIKEVTVVDPTWRVHKITMHCSRNGSRNTNTVLDRSVYRRLGSPNKQRMAHSRDLFMELETPCMHYHEAVWLLSDITAYP